MQGTGSAGSGSFVRAKEIITSIKNFDPQVRIEMISSRFE